MPRHEVATPDGRTLSVLEEGAPGGPLVIGHHGTPGAGLLHRTEIESAERLGLRLIAYDRAGYGGSTAHAGRRVADVAGDVAAIADALGAERFATYGWSGGGPHALACAALLGDRCAAVATIAGVGEITATDLDWFAGMGEGNQEEFGTARKGREPLAAMLREETAGLLSASGQDLAAALRPHLSERDVGGVQRRAGRPPGRDVPPRPGRGDRRLARRRPRLRGALGLRLLRRHHDAGADLAGRAGPDGPGRARRLAAVAHRRRRGRHRPPRAT